jgi:CRP/FNR family transcriptional regulator
MGFSKANTPNCYTCKFKNACFFSLLEPSAQKTFNEIKMGSNFKNKDLVNRTGEKPSGIYMICRGRVKIYTTDVKGQQLITWVRHPGEVFGHISFFACKENYCNAECMGETILSFIDCKALNDFLDRYSKINLVFLKLISTELMNFQIKLKDAAYKPAKSKIADTLIKSVSFKTRNTPTPTIYGLKRTEIAEITGLALETVVRALQDMEKKSIIKREANCIKIIDYNALSKITHHR